MAYLPTSHVRNCLVLGAAAVLAATGAAAAQEPLPLLGVEVDLADYGISDLDAVVHGRVSVVHDPSGLRLAPQFLLTTPPPPASAPRTTTLPPLDGSAGDPLSALWVWTTDELLSDEAERGRFLSFVEAQGIGRVFLHLPAGDGLRPAAGFVPFDGTALGPLVAELRARGALTYGLDGDPYYVRPENRAGVVRTVRRMVEHNRDVPPEQRFHGIRYDVEPYLLPGFQGPERQRILDDYVELVAAAAAAAREGGLVFGVDIPFWLDGPDEASGAPFEASLAGRRQLVLQHVMSLVDDVAIMAYRTTATGPDGVVRHSGDELVRAQDAGVEVFVGVETTHLYDEDLFTFRGRGRQGLPALAEASWVLLERRPDGRSHVWLAEGEEALQALARQAEGSELRYWFAGPAIPLPGDRLSFYSLGADVMELVTAGILGELAGRTSFAGLAFHDYQGLRTLLESR